MKGGYLLRTVDFTNAGGLAITGDLNKTSTLEIIAPAAQSRGVSFNSANLVLSRTTYGTLLATKEVKIPEVTIPILGSLLWVSAGACLWIRYLVH